DNIPDRNVDTFAPMQERKRDSHGCIRAPSITENVGLWRSIAAFMAVSGSPDAARREQQACDIARHNLAATTIAHLATLLQVARLRTTNYGFVRFCGNCRSRSRLISAVRSGGTTSLVWGSKTIPSVARA